MKKHMSVALFVLTLSFVFSSLSATAAVTSSAKVTTTDSPAWIIIPAINLFSPVQNVGVNNKGDMDVPSGRTDNVGWYAYGTTPGDIGTAVLDAHNTAAFKNLHSLKPGDDIYIMTMHGDFYHFAVSQANTYPIKTLSPSTLFASTNTRQINLITCAGKPLGNGDTTQRLIVSAQML